MRWHYAFLLRFFFSTAISKAFKNHCSIFPDFNHIQITIFYKYKKKKLILLSFRCRHAKYIISVVWAIALLTALPIPLVSRLSQPDPWYEQCGK